MATTETKSNAGRREYGLKEIPEGVVNVTEENRRDDTILKWSGKQPIPRIGQRVKINFNELGTGTVESYLVEAAWVGVQVRLDKEPAWKVKQHKGTKYEGTAMVFGIEITVLN